MQGLASQLNFVVIDMPAAFDVILGDARLTSMKAQLDYASATCTVKGKGKSHVILFMNAPAQKPSPTQPAVLSYALAKRWSKHEFSYCLFVVKQVPDTTDTDASVVCSATSTESQDPRVAQLQADYPTVFTDNPKP
jgi:hypothetical protein